MISFVITALVIIFLVVLAAWFIFTQYRKTLREAKNYERGLKMVPLYIHIPPTSEDLEANGRDERDVREEVLSQAQVMYNIIASTATKGFRSRIYGQRHFSFEIVAHEGLLHYYAVVPTVLVEVVRHAVAAAYPAARLEKVTERNVFNQSGNITGTVGGEFTLKKDYVYPIATYQESKQDVTRALLNALSAVAREDGAAVQVLLRPAHEGWASSSVAEATKIRKEKGAKRAGFIKGLPTAKDMFEALWKPPETAEAKVEDKQLSSLEQSVIESIEEKTRHPGYEVLIRVVASSDTSAKAQIILKNIIAAFALFDSPTNNGFKFTSAREVDDLVTAYLFRFFPQSVTQNVLNSVELATVFHLPNQNTIPSSQVQRQAIKQVDGPIQQMEEGLLLGYNEFRGVKKEIRLAQNDRRRHSYIIGQTGTGKSVLLENLAFQDMMDGKGFAFIDPHGDSAERLLGMVPKDRVEDVIYFSPGDMENPIGLNLFEFDNPDQQDFLIQESIAMLYRLYDPGHTGIVGPRFESWFRNAALTVMSDPNGSSFLDVQQVFIDQAFADEKIKYITNRTVLDFWNKEMAQTTDANKSEMLGWFASKFGAFLTNEMMRNIIGQTKSGFNLRDIMDNKKILLVNLSKGRTGELNSQLLGMIFVMKFQAAAMGRADIPEDEREDFTLYVDEFQNFATDSFATILSEARKYRLSLVLANQFMTQLTDQIRESVLGNVGTVIGGRIGITDADVLQKRFQPTFDAEDLTKLPNFQTITTVMINNVPSAPFSMGLVPSMGVSNPQLRDALKRLSAAKYGRPRAQVEQEFFARIGAGDEARKAKMEALKKAQQERLSAMNPGGSLVPPTGPPAGPPSPYTPPQPAPAAGSSFVNEWLNRREQLPPPSLKPAQPPTQPQPTVVTPVETTSEPAPLPAPPMVEAKPESLPSHDGQFHIRQDTSHKDSGEVSIKLR